MLYQVTVVGASNIDISATTQNSLILGDSNPGRVTLGFGGVGRNIAENLARLKVHTRLISAYGNDAFAILLKRQAQEIGLDISQSLDSTSLSSSVYICVNEPDGEMHIAVSDMDICKTLSPAFLKEKLAVMQQSDALILDANLSADALHFLAENATIPLFADSVSTKKAVRLQSILPKLTGLKTNRQEAELLTGLAVQTKEDVPRAAQALHEMGVRYVLITLGEKGGCLSDGSSIEFMPSMVQKLVNTTGCGDACFSGMVYAFLQGKSCREMLKISMAMAEICAESPSAVSPMISPQNVKNHLNDKA